MELVNSDKQTTLENYSTASGIKHSWKFNIIYVKKDWLADFIPTWFFYQREALVLKIRNSMEAPALRT